MALEQGDCSGIGATALAREEAERRHGEGGEIETNRHLLKNSEN